MEIYKYGNEPVYCNICRKGKLCNEMYLNGMYVIICDDCMLKLKKLLTRRLLKEGAWFE
jgi:hypothetical protein